MKAPLIFLEGISGAGKDSNIEFIRNYFIDRDYSVRIIQEPPEFIRPLLEEYRKKPDEKRNPIVEALLFGAGRAELYEKEVKPFNWPGSAIISNRSKITSCVYQSMKGVDLKTILDINRFYPNPDLSIVFFCEPEIALQRIQKRAIEEGKKISNDETLEKIARIKEGYEQVITKCPEFNAKIIRTDGTFSAVQTQIDSVLNAYMGQVQHKAVFLDKDGTIVDNSMYPDEIPTDKIYPESVEALKILKSVGYKLIIVSNQSWIAKGKMTQEQVEDVFQSIIRQYRDKGIKIDDYFYCPHTRHDGCECKKPGTGILEKAIKEHSISIGESYMIGDTYKDAVAGRNMGLSVMLVETGNGDKHFEKVKDCLVFKDIKQASEAIRASHHFMNPPCCFFFFFN